MSEMPKSTQEVEERKQFMLFNVIQLPEGSFGNTSNINENSIVNRSTNTRNESYSSINQPQYVGHNECVNCPTNNTEEIITNRGYQNDDANTINTAVTAAARYNNNNNNNNRYNANNNNINFQQSRANAPKCNQVKREFDYANATRMSNPYQQLPLPPSQEEYYERQVYMLNQSQPNVQCQHTVTHVNKNCVNYIMETNTTPCNYSSPAITPTTAVTASSPAVHDVLYTPSCADPLLVKREADYSSYGPHTTSFQPPLTRYTNPTYSSPSYSSPQMSQKEERITPSSYASPETNASPVWPDSDENDVKERLNEMPNEHINSTVSGEKNSIGNENSNNTNNVNNNININDSGIKMLQTASYPSFTMLQENTNEPLYEVLPYSCDILLEHNIDSLDQVQCILHGKKRSAQNMMLARNKKTNELIWWCRNTSRCKVRACEQQNKSPNNNQSGKVMVKVVRCDQPHQMRFIANLLHSPSHLNTFHRYATQTCEANNNNNITKSTKYHLEPVTPTAENAFNKSHTPYDGYFLAPYTNVKLVTPINVATNRLLYQEIQQQQEEHQHQHQEQVNRNANSFDSHQQSVKLSNTIAVISPPQQPTSVVLTSQKYQHEPYRQVMMLPNSTRDCSQTTFLPESNSRYGQNNIMYKNSVGNAINELQEPYQHHIQQQQQQQQQQQFQRPKRNIRTTPTPVQIIKGNALPLYIPFCPTMGSQYNHRYSLNAQQQQQQFHEHQQSQLPPQQYHQLYQSTSVAQPSYAPQIQYNHREEIALPKTDNYGNA